MIYHLWVTTWILSIVFTLYLACQKRLNLMIYFLLSFFLGPIAVLIVLFSKEKTMPMKMDQIDPRTLEDAKQMLADLHYQQTIQADKIKKLEDLINNFKGANDKPTTEAKKEEPQSQPAKIEKNFVEKYLLTEDFQPKPNSQMNAKQLHQNNESTDRNTDSQYVSANQGVSKNEDKSDLEMDFARNWLNKIGIVVLALGIAYLITYTLINVGPIFKISLGFFSALLLFIIGAQLERKENLVNFGRVLLAGAWAIMYFTTFAMYHFETSRIIYSQALDLSLLGLVVLGMILHAFKYKSEMMMAVVLLVAYVTIMIGQITFYTFMTCLFLAVLILFLIYRFQWVRILFLGIIMSYLIHLFWVAPRILNSVDFLPYLETLRSPYFLNSINFLFITAYGLVFFMGAHLIQFKDHASDRQLAAISLGNIAFYNLLAYPIILNMFGQGAVVLMLIQGMVFMISATIMKHINRPQLFIAYVCAAIFALTLSVYLQWKNNVSLIIWLMEIPLLLFIGSYFKERVYQYLAYGLSMIVIFRLMVLIVFKDMFPIDLMGVQWEVTRTISQWASLSMGVSFYLCQQFKENNSEEDFNSFMSHVFSLFSMLFLANWILGLVQQSWVAFVISAFGWLSLLIYHKTQLKRFQVYTYLAFTISVMLFIGIPIVSVSKILKWIIVSFNIISILGAYHVINYLRSKYPNNVYSEDGEKLIFALGVLLLCFAIYQNISSQWMSLVFGLAGVMMMLIGFVKGVRMERIGGIFFLAITLLNVLIFDLSDLDVIFKITTLIILGVLFLAVSYVYNRFK